MERHESQKLHAYSGEMQSVAFHVRLDDETSVLYDALKLKEFIEESIRGYEQVVDIDRIIQAALNNMFNDMSFKELTHVLVLSTSQFIELDTAYSYIAARLLNYTIFYEIVGFWPTKETYEPSYRLSFIDGIHRGIEVGMFDKRLLDFDLDYLSKQLCIERDDIFKYLGLKTLHNRYLKSYQDKYFEMPQSFWMRVAMGLALHEENKNEKVLEFYHAISQMLFVPSTPTLLHSGLTRAQLSSCFLTFVDDDLKHIFKCVGDNAQMSKWSGGVANDWSALRATGAMIESINTHSQGVIPFLKVANDTTAAINRSGKRRGAVCAYMEAWHYDYEDFLDLRRNTGDERRRTHDMNTASWIPDLFMKRMLADEMWSFFSPDETPELHELYGKAFEEKYVEYEQKAARGEIKLYRQTPAKQLWRKLLTRLFETGHPWPTFKDACNVRSPQDHVGVVHSSNLCTEITLNTSREETAVCNLGSVNLGKMVVDGAIDEVLLGKTVNTAIRMLDNVIDLNFYATQEAETANQRHRPTGLGMMGLQDAVFKMGYAFDSDEALDLTDELAESVAYHAIMASSLLAQERGAYSSYKGSKWDRNIFPIDTIDLLAQERGMQIEKIGKERKDWSIVRDQVAKHGMRNSNTMAVAPTATISNISGCYPCIEPIYKNLYVKSNSGGDFTVVNTYLLDELKQIGLWSEEMRDKIKYYDGSIQQIEEIPANIRAKYKTAFELDGERMVEMTAARGKWIDQSQSHNVFLQGTSGKKLHSIYVKGWLLGQKTFYYLRSQGASQIEKSTLDASKYGFTQMREYDKTKKADVNKAGSPEVQDFEEIAAKACRLNDPDCDSCQ